MPTITDDRARTMPLYLYNGRGQRVKVGYEVVLELRMSPDQYATLRRLADARSTSSQGFLLSCLKEERTC